MKKFVLFIFCISNLSILANENPIDKSKKTTKVNLENNKENTTYDVKNNPNKTTQDQEEYDYYKKRGEESPQFDNLSFMGKLGVIFASWTKSPDTIDHMENKS